VRILSIIGNGSGSAYYRQHVPMSALKAAGYPVTIRDQSVVPNAILASHDVVQLSRIVATDDIVKLMQHFQGKGLLVNVDFDDDLINIPAHNPAKDIDPTAVLRTIQTADAITVSTEALAASYRPYAKRIGIVPNYMDVAHWPKKVRPPADENLAIGLVGSASHHEDWRMIAEPMRRIMETYDVNFIIAGYLPDYLKDIVTEFIGWQDVFTYQSTVNRIDIGLCPLIDDAFNKKKTFIKAMEYGMAGAAVVASPTLYRDIVQGRGLIARDEQGWYDAIEAMIVSPALRNNYAKALHECVVSRWDVRKHTAEIYQTYRNLFKASGRQKPTLQEALRGTERRTMA
jgi:glycosyltransferase involved in cell wall biosynthesis